MILCLDVGNSHMHGGVYDGKEFILQFRHETKQHVTSDQIGIFLRSVLRENDINIDDTEAISICSVVPSFDYTLNAACEKYFNIQPFFIKTGVKTGLKVATKNPQEVGSDLIAGAIAGVAAYPGRDLIIVDFGSATTYSIVTANKEYQGAIFFPGFRLSMRALSGAAKLFPVEIVKPENLIGRNTIESIQSGLYFSQLATLREIVDRFKQESLSEEDPVVIGTGGFAYLLDDEGLLDIIIPDLVLEGAMIAYNKNK